MYIYYTCSTDENKFNVKHFIFGIYHIFEKYFHHSCLQVLWMINKSKMLLSIYALPFCPSYALAVYDNVLYLFLMLPTNFYQLVFLVVHGWFPYTSLWYPPVIQWSKYHLANQGLFPRVELLKGCFPRFKWKKRR